MLRKNLANLALACSTLPALLFPTITQAGIQISPIGTYASGVFDEGAAEINAYDAVSQQLYVVNADAGGIDVIDISDPTAPTLVQTIDLSTWGRQANSVAIHNGLLVAAVEAEDKQSPGRAVFFDAADGSYRADVVVGALPDMVTFTPDGAFALVANEGEPDDDYLIDPEGSVSVIDLRGIAVEQLTAQQVKTADFNQPNLRMVNPDSIRVFGPNASMAQDFEPEYITVYQSMRRIPAGRKFVPQPKWRAMVSLQENNAIAELNVEQAHFTRVIGLGSKDYSLPRNAIDASNKDDAIRITAWPVQSFYQPDAIASFSAGGKTYIVSANEGDARDYDGFSEEIRVADLLLDPERYPNALELQKNENLGRLLSTTVNGDWDDDGDVDQIYGYGARSFSIWTTSGRQVYDSGSDFEHITASQLPDYFNSQGDNASFDARSDDKGPEPEGVVVASIQDRSIAFIGLERVGGIMVYDVTEPRSPFFVQYINTADFSVEEGGDIAPEGLSFIPAQDSPNGKPLLVVSFEVSGTTTIFQIEDGVSLQAE